MTREIRKLYEDTPEAFRASGERHTVASVVVAWDSEVDGPHISVGHSHYTPDQARTLARSIVAAADAAAPSQPGPLSGQDGSPDGDVPCELCEGTTYRLVIAGGRRLLAVCTSCGTRMPLLSAERGQP
jgi:hypothetical protein